MKWVPGICAAAGLLAMCGPTAAHDNSLRVALAGTAPIGYKSFFDAAILRPFARSTRQPARLVPQTAAWDVAQLDPVALADACSKGSVQKLDWPALGGRARFLPLATSDCGAGATLSATVLTWDRAKTRATPDWGDFWNVARYPGQRALRRSPVGTLEIALLADGVAPRDIYPTLAGRGGPERAFRKLDQLRPYIVWWQQDDEPMRIVAAGRALMSSAPSEQVAAASRRLHHPFGLGWAGAIVTPRAWAIAATTPRLAAAEALINAATTNAAQARQTAQTGFGSTLAADPTSVPAASPAAHLAGAVTFDADFWQHHRVGLEARFSAWISR